MPSTFTRFDRARWPLMFNPELRADPVEGALSLTTCESVVVNLM
jgi:hypothetical protein